jgi:hypothetical protein
MSANQSSRTHILTWLQGVLATAGSGELPYNATKVSDEERSGELLEAAVADAPRSRLIQVTPDIPRATGP